MSESEERRAKDQKKDNERIDNAKFPFHYVPEDKVFCL